VILLRAVRCLTHGPKLFGFPHFIKCMRVDKWAYLCRLSSMGKPTDPEEPRMSFQSMKVLSSFLTEPAREWSGADLIAEGGVPSGTLYPLLYRFEEAGWLAGRWEKGDPREMGRPLRKLYRMTGRGLAKVAEVRGRLPGGIAT
jgi:PadR family transcriptional regulator PadR